MIIFNYEQALYSERIINNALSIILYLFNINKIKFNSLIHCNKVSYLTFIRCFSLFKHRCICGFVQKLNFSLTRIMH